MIPTEHGSGGVQVVDGDELCFEILEFGVHVKADTTEPVFVGRAFVFVFIARWKVELPIFLNIPSFISNR